MSLPTRLKANQIEAGGWRRQEGREKGTHLHSSNTPKNKKTSQQHGNETPTAAGSRTRDLETSRGRRRDWEHHKKQRKVPGQERGGEVSSSGGEALGQPNIVGGGKEKKEVARRNRKKNGPQRRDLSGLRL